MILNSRIEIEVLEFLWSTVYSDIILIIVAVFGTQI